MKQFYFYFIVVILIFSVSCSKETKTKPIVFEEQKQVSIEEKEKNQTKSVEDITGVITIEVNKTMEYISAEEEQEKIKDQEGQEPKKTIIIQDLQFKPEKIRIPKGTTVIWKHQDKYNNQDNIYHTIVVYPLGKKSQRMSYGDSFNMTFDNTGSFYFIDVIYKEQMRGDIIVE